MIDDNPMIERGESVANQGTATRICEEVREALGGMKCGKAVGRMK